MCTPFIVHSEMEKLSTVDSDQSDSGLGVPRVGNVLIDLCKRDETGGNRKSVTDKVQAPRFRA